MRRPQDHRIAHVCQALKMQPTLPLTQLTQMAHLSESRLQHLFREQTGLSITQYAKDIKLELARSLLSETQQPIKAICAEVGIPDYSNLVKHFRNRFGVTPIEYRKLRKSA